MYSFSPWLALFAGLTVIAGAVYMLRAYKRIMFGELTVDAKVFHPLTTNEKILLGIITILVIVGGIYPKPLLEIAEPSLRAILEKSGAALMR